MNYGLAGQVVTVVIASAAIVAVIIKRTREWYQKPLTVEAERSGAELVVGSIPQWQWRGLNDAESESCDDPVFALIHELSVSPHQAQM